MKHREKEFKGRLVSITLEGGHEAQFKIPMEAMLVPVHAAIASLEGYDSLQEGLRMALAMDVAGFIVAYLWADSEFALTSNWRKQKDGSSAVLEELFEGCEALYKTNKGNKKRRLVKEAYVSWTTADIFNVLRFLIDTLNISTTPAEEDIEEAVNFTKKTAGGKRSTS